LFALLGTSYGAGDGTTTFNIPDYRGRTLVGHDASQTEFDVLGETGGAKTHTMTVAEMPVHRHDLQRPPWKTAERTAGNQVWGPAGGPYIQHTDSGSVQFSGGDEPHNNLQPYTVVKWIICAATSSGNFDTEVQTALVTSVSALQASVAVTRLEDIAGLSFMSDWGNISNTFCRVGNLVDIRLNFTYSGPTITAGSDANIPDQVICTIPSEWAAPSLMFMYGTRHGFAGFGFRLNTNGEFLLAAASFPGQTIASGHNFVVQIVFTV
jgi:microcystin-dependent protein